MKTPIGVFKYCHLNKPDTRFNAEGSFSVTAVFDKDDPVVAEFLDEMNALHKAAGAEGKEKFSKMKPAAKKKLEAKGIKGCTLMPFYEEIYDEEDEPTGEISIRFKTSAQYISKKTGEPVQKVVPLVDGKGRIIPTKKRPLVYGGTTGRIDFVTRNSFIPATGAAYLSIYMNKVQIAELVGPGGGGFDEISGSSFDADDLEEYGGDDDSEDTGSDLDDTVSDDLDGDLDGSGAADDGSDDLDDEIPF